MCLSRCNTATQIYVVRFLVGLAESAFYPGMQYVIGSWYRKDELAKRSCIFHTSSALGTMFSGYLMAAVYHLGGKGGYKGWQWYVSLSSGLRINANLPGCSLLMELSHFQLPSLDSSFYPTFRKLLKSGICLKRCVSHMLLAQSKADQ
jgi:ACS family pantothenate transporter-like MFS transporter